MKKYDLQKLLKEMTLKEKLGQLTMFVSGYQCYEKAGDKFELKEYAVDHMKKYGIGILSTLFRADPWSGKKYGNTFEMKDRADFINAFQKRHIEETRLGIPMLLDLECTHGMQSLDSITFPCNITMGCSFNHELYGKVAESIARELRLSGVHIGFMSGSDMLTDPRFGRSEETFGEDPYLSSQMVKNAVLGFGRAGTVYCLKHFCCHGSALGGQMSGAVDCSEREIREIALPAAKAGVKAGAEVARRMV